ncbi:MAG: TetR family transcriptional regulator [Devosia sp.]|nr:TetR family transcriptional regulator [Devosia sp.]
MPSLAPVMTMVFDMGAAPDFRLCLLCQLLTHMAIADNAAMSNTSTGLRERTRRAVRREIAETASRLFLERGYAATTIDDIAAVVGMSQRSVFRYFPTKEDLLLEKFDLAAEQLLDRLARIPAAEPIWSALRQAFEVMVPETDRPGHDAAAEAIMRVVFGSTSLFAGYLERLQRMQDDVVALLRDGRPGATADLRAVVGAGFGCLVAAQRSWLDRSDPCPFAAMLDRAMAMVAPAPPPRQRH